MEQFGARLRAIRQEWGLTLREVEERSAHLAEEWGNPSYRISASWLDRIEREYRGLSAAKLIVLAAVYSVPPDQLLALYSRGSGDPPQLGHLSSPNTTLLLSKGPLEQHARLWLPDSIAIEPIPDETTLLSPESHLPSYYRRGIIGRSRQDAGSDGSPWFHRSDQYAATGRCTPERMEERIRSSDLLCPHSCRLLLRLVRTGQEHRMVTLVPHSLSYATGQRWRYRKEVEVIGRVAVVLLRLEEPQPAT